MVASVRTYSQFPWFETVHYCIELVFSSKLLLANQIDFLTDLRCISSIAAEDSEQGDTYHEGKSQKKAHHEMIEDLKLLRNFLRKIQFSSISSVNRNKQLLHRRYVCIDECVKCNVHAHEKEYHQEKIANTKHTEDNERV